MDPDLVKAGRRKLEEIRQKKVSSAGTASGVLASVLGDKDYAHAVKVPDATGIDLKRCDELEQEIESLKQSLRSMTMERDAAIVAREDLNTQVRILKRKLQDAEEEQYRAEEDVVALKKELELLQQSERPFIHSIDLSVDLDKLKSAEQEIDALRLELQSLEQQLRQEQQKSAALHEHFELVTAQNCELQNSLTTGACDKSVLQESLAAAAEEKDQLQKALAAALASPFNLGRDLVSTATSGSVDVGTSFITDRSRYEEQLHHLQYMLEKQEKGTLRLLNEVDAQSLEIERLFEENSSLAASLSETSALASKWEDQLKDSLQQNHELRLKVNQLQSAQSSVPYERSSTPKIEECGELQDGSTDSEAGLSSNLITVNSELRSELAAVTAHSEELQAQVERMTVELSHALHVLGNISRAYQPVLLNIESRLAGLHQDFRRSIY